MVSSPLRALAKFSMPGENFAGVFVASDKFAEAMRTGRLFQNDRILEGMPDGVVLMDADNNVQWANNRICRWAQCDDVVNKNFYELLGSPEILGPDFCPFHTALATQTPSNSTLRIGDNVFLQVHAAPLLEGDGEPQHLIVTVRDVTAEMLQQQKMAAIHQAGQDLSNLKPDEVFEMSVEDRIELLKSNILHYTQDLLHFDVVEIRLMDQKTGKLEPLLSVGIDPEPATRPLCADTKNNGVTGFVAATGKSYLCEDTTEDPLYIEGFKGACSSLTVPLILHDEVIGTFNVESPEVQAFNENDLQFLEIFSRDVAVALNTLELLVAQRANTAQESVEAIHSAVALPIDEILNEAVSVMERYIGHDSDVRERMERILRNARDIKQVIQKVGRTMAPAKAVPDTGMPRRTKLMNRRVLVVDADDAVRNDAHALLERYHCIVETAHHGDEAVYMVRNSSEVYDLIISDIRLPDYSGYQLMVRLQQIMEHVPLILMTGFGYDPGHSIVKARQAGLHPRGILYKPFRLDQLLETCELVLMEHLAALDKPV
ncbi:MAG: response regulator [Planctomycetales bacterium]|nr:response regulator [Planctomycetales bacterium]